MLAFARQKGKISDLCLLLNKGPLFTGLTKKKKKSSQHKEQLEEIALLFFTLSQMTRQSLTSFFLIVLKHNVVAPAWFYCPVYLHDWAGREKHHVLLWIVEVCLRSVFFFFNSCLVWAESFIRHLSVQLHANIACKSGPASWTACTNWLCLQLHSNALTQPQTENLCRLIQELIAKLICHSCQEVIASLINIYHFPL